MPVLSWEITVEKHVAVFEKILLVGHASVRCVSGANMYSSCGKETLCIVGKLFLVVGWVG